MRFPVDGHELDYEIRGDGRPLVLLHGLAVDRRVLIDTCEPALEALGGFRRIYVDLPGHGASTANLERVGADSLVASLSAFVREVAGPQPFLLGYAYGGYLAQGILRELPEAGGLFLVCPTVEADFGKRNVPPRRVLVRESPLPYSDDPREQPAFEEVAVLQTRPLLERFQRVVHLANIAADQETMARTRGAYAMSRPYMQALQAFERPVAVVCGRDDHWVGYEDGLRLVRAFRRAEYVVLPDCGHLLPLEQPDRFRATLESWLKRL